MRGLALFVAGILVGSTMQGVAAQQERRLLGLSHVALSVPNLDEAVQFYTNTLGLTEAFAVRDPDGRPMLTYLQISRETFLELQPSTVDRPPGFSHFGLRVDDMSTAVTQFRQRGLKVRDPVVSAGTQAHLAQAMDLNGIRVELQELGPESLHGKAMEAWK